MAKEHCGDDYLCMIGGSPLAELKAEQDGDVIWVSLFSSQTGESSYFDADQCEKIGRWFAEAAERLRNESATKAAIDLQGR